MHPGGKALLAIDLDGDTDKDLLAGHEQCEELYLFKNYGTPDSAIMIDYSRFFPDSVNPANFHIFPAGYFEDLDFDGVKDLLVAPNVDFNIEYKVDFRRSNLFYKNTGTDSLPVFDYQKSDFMQSQMLDLGENTVPRLIDWDLDGDLDLFVSANGFYNGERFSGFVNYFENTGGNSQASFVLADSNFLSLSQLDLKDTKICFADMNGDANVDLLYTGINYSNLEVKSFVFYNQADRDSSPVFVFEDRKPIVLPELFVMNDTPEFFDVNNDGLTDLLVGKQDGALQYYINRGTHDSEDFVLEDGSFLGIGRDFSLERIFLVAVVGDIDQNGEQDIVTTDYRGVAQIFFDFQSNLDEPMAVQVVQQNTKSEQVEPVHFDNRSWLSVGDINNKGVGDIIAGGVRGGLQLFNNDEQSVPPGEEDRKIALELYPNPVLNSQPLTIKSNQDVLVEIVNTLGQSVREEFKVKKFVQYEISLQHLASGLYIIKATNSSGRIQSDKVVITR
jgi:hypothetical protein